MKEKYKDHRFSYKAEATIKQANRIINEYLGQGLRLTVRQLYYQFVARDLLQNTHRNYKNLVNLLRNARLAGRIDWNAIIDETRNLYGVSTWADPSEAIEEAASNYHIDCWEDQDYRIEVWIEKDALRGVIAPTCSDLRVDYFACKGYPSISELRSAAERFIHSYGHQNVVILHLGDHDPSGIDMTRNLVDSLELLNASVEIERIALNMDQVDRYSPPPNYAKVTDSRYGTYAAEFGTDSWELDALEPRVIQRLIRDTVAQYRDDEKYEEMLNREADERLKMQEIAKNWDNYEE